jgi:FemAB family
VPANFLQSTDWSNFWVKSNNQDHKIYSLVSETNTANGLEKFSTILYKYPWKFNQTWLYIPRFGSGFNINTKKDATIVFQSTVSQALKIGKEIGATLLKIDFDNTFYTFLLNGDSLNESGEKSHSKYLANLISQEIVESPRQINFLSTIVLDISKIQPNKYELVYKNGDTFVDKFLVESESRPSFSLSLDELKNFFTNNSDFWNKTNQNIRRYTKKSLDINWKVEIDTCTFDEWYEIHYTTAKRQKFATHPKKYLKELFEEKFTHSIVLKDVDGVAQSAWLGGIFEDTIVYLHGGNKQGGFDKYGQYLIHLAAIYIGKAYNCNFYDLGGWEEGKGFSKFKEGYKGQIEKYPGAYDVILKEPDYFLTRLSQWFKKRG